MSRIIESNKTLKARKLLVDRFRDNNFYVEGPPATPNEKTFYCKNNMGEWIYPPYQADLYLRLEFIIELDPNSSHKSEHQHNHDLNRDKNIWREYGLKTVRLNPSDISEKTLETVDEEIVNQLRSDKYQ